MPGPIKVLSCGNLGAPSTSAILSANAASTTCHQSRLSTFLFPSVDGTKTYLVFQHPAGAGPITIRASVQIGATVYRCIDTPGVYSKVLAVSDGVDSEYLMEVENCPNLAVITQVWVHTKVDFAIGQAPLHTCRFTTTDTTLPYSVWSNDTNSASTSLNPTTPAGTDLTLSGATWPVSNSYQTTCYGPTAIVGTPLAGNNPSVLHSADSIGDVDPLAFRGGVALSYLDTATAPGRIPHILAMVNGSTSGAFAISNRYKNLAKYVDCVLELRGVNDLSTTTGAELANVRNARTLIVTHFKTANGCRVYFSTIVPRTLDATAIAADRWKLEAPQTAFNVNYGVDGSGARGTLNTEVTNLTNYGGFNGYYDFSAQISGVSPHKWGVFPDLSRKTADGLHPLSPAQQAIRTSFNKYLFFPTDNTPPTFTSTIDSGGAMLTLAFSEQMATPSNVTGLSIVYGVTNYPILYEFWSDNTTLRCVMPRAALSSDAPTINYNSGTGNLADLAVPANAAATVTDGAITNNSTISGGGSGSGGGFRRRPTRGRG